MPTRFLTLAEVCEVLSISSAQGYAIVRSGELPAIQVGGRNVWRVEQEVLEDYIQGKYADQRRAAVAMTADADRAPSRATDAGDNTADPAAP